MMAESDDDYKFGSDAGLDSKRANSFLSRQVPTKSDEQYMEESARELSAALGSGWDPRELDRRADESKQALLNGIGSGKVLGSIRSLMEAMDSGGGAMSGSVEGEPF